MAKRVTREDSSESLDEWENISREKETPWETITGDLLTLDHMNDLDNPKKNEEEGDTREENESGERDPKPGRDGDDHSDGNDHEEEEDGVGSPLPTNEHEEPMGMIDHAPVQNKSTLVTRNKKERLTDRESRNTENSDWELEPWPDRQAKVVDKEGPPAIGTPEVTTIDESQDSTHRETSILTKVERRKLTNNNSQLWKYRERMPEEWSVSERGSPLEEDPTNVPEDIDVSEEGWESEPTNDRQDILMTYPEDPLADVIEAARRYQTGQIVLDWERGLQNAARQANISKDKNRQNTSPDENIPGEPIVEASIWEDRSEREEDTRAWDGPELTADQLAYEACMNELYHPQGAQKDFLM